MSHKLTSTIEKQFSELEDPRTPITAPLITDMVVWKSGSVGLFLTRRE
jgi:hypothetical protein